MRKLLGDIEVPEILSEEEQLRYFKLYNETRSIYYRNIIVEHNLGLITSVINRKTNSQDAEDLFSFGEEALINSVEKFDITRGTKFSTYACKNIENAINHYYAYNNREKRNGDIVSLYEPIYSDTKKLLYIDIIRDESMIGEKSLLYVDFNFVLEKFLNTLSEKDIDIFNMYFGLNGYREHVQREIALKYGITSQRVSSKINNLLMKLKKYLILSGYHLDDVKKKKYCK